MEKNWTYIYVDFNNEGMFYCVRLTPYFVDLESLGFSHGLGLAGEFKTKEDAEKYAMKVEVFMNEVVKALKE